MNKNTKHMLAAAAIASLVGFSGTALAKKGAKAAPKAEKAAAGVKCEGGNSCKGHSECKTAENACKGQNGCGGKGFVMAKNDAECADMKTKAAAPKAETKAN